MAAIVKSGLMRMNAERGQRSDRITDRIRPAHAAESDSGNQHRRNQRTESPVDVQGEDLQWVGMAPLAVDEKYRGQGLARQLVYEGLDSLNEFGYAAVVTLGDPALYSRFGFELAAHHDLRCRWPGTESAFQVHRLADDALNGVTGLVEYHEHFNRF